MPVQHPWALCAASRHHLLENHHLDDSQNLVPACSMSTLEPWHVCSSFSRKETQTESEIDDDASVAESFVSLSRVRRTEPERIAYFKNQPECSEIDPHRVWCTRCQKHVSLGKKQTYAVRPWEKHREKCDQKVPKSMLYVIFSLQLN